MKKASKNKEKPTGRIRLAIYLDADQIEWVKKKAAEMRIDESAIVRLELGKLMESENA